MASVEGMTDADVRAIFRVLSGGHCEHFISAVALHPGLVRAKDDSLATPLHWLAFHGHLEGLRRALSLGAEVNSATDSLQTPVAWAAIQGQTSAIEALVAAGADLGLKDSMGATPAVHALLNGRHLALLLLVDLGAPVDIPDVRGCTAAHWAAVIGSVPALTALSRRGASLTAVDRDGLEPLHRAARGACLDAARFLIDEAGVNPLAPVHRAHARDGDAATPLTIAESSLSEMLTSSETPGGAYYGPEKKVSIDRQRELVDFLRTRSAERSTLALSSPWVRQLRSAVAALLTPRGTARVLVPAGYLALGAGSTLAWLMFFVSQQSALLTVTHILVLGALTCVFGALYVSDADALDPYGTLGRDGWPALMPWHVLAGLRPAAQRPRGSARLSAVRRFLADFDSEEAAFRSGLGDLGAFPALSSMPEAEQRRPQKLTHTLTEPGLGPLHPRAVTLARVCTTCEIIRPLRAKHDAITGRCYDRYDHFCKLIGTPITRANYRMFWAFTVLQVHLGLAYSLSANTLFLSDLWSHLTASIGGSETTLASLVRALWICPWGVLGFAAANIFGFCFALWMFLQHAVLSARNETTNEAINGHRYDHLRGFKVGAAGAVVPLQRNPFHTGSLWGNITDSFGLSARPRRVGAAEVAALIAADVDAVALDVLAQMAAAVEARRGAAAPGRDAASASGAHAGSPNLRLRRRLADAAAELPPVDSVRAGVLSMRASLVDEDTWLRFTRSGGSRTPAAPAPAAAPAVPAAHQAHAARGQFVGAAHGHSHGGLPCDGQHGGGAGGGASAAPPSGGSGRKSAPDQAGHELHGP